MRKREIDRHFGMFARDLTYYRGTDGRPGFRRQRQIKRVLCQRLVLGSTEQSI